MARVFQPSCRSACSTDSKPTPPARAIAASGSACRSCARWSSCMAARSAFSRRPGGHRGGLRVPARARGVMPDPAPAMPQNPSDSLDLVLPSERATLDLAREIAVLLAPGDMVTLSGDLGTGKTTFARALIRRLAGDESLEVPSPTFTLLQIYDLPRHHVIHADLYRVNAPDELVELGFADFSADAIALVEWPDRAPGALPADRLDL